MLSRFVLACLVCVALLASSVSAHVSASGSGSGSASASSVESASDAIEWVDAVLLESIEGVSAPRRPSDLLPGQSCPVVFTSTVTRTTPHTPTAKKTNGKRPKVGKRSKKGKSLVEVEATHSSFLEADASQEAGVPALTAAQLAQCEADKKRFLEGKASASLTATVVPPPKGKGIGGQKFTSLVNGATNSQIWAPTISEKVRSAIADFTARKRLPNGRIYGGSVREVSLTGKTVAQVEKALKKFQCVKENQLIKNATNNQPIVAPNGRTMPMLTYICPDGGAIRLKPEGEATSKFRPQPHGAKALRYPYDSPFLTFDDEVIKVDNSPAANPLPKWGKDLFVFFPEDKAQQFDATDAWADRAHADLKK